MILPTRIRIPSQATSLQPGVSASFSRHQLFWASSWWFQVWKLLPGAITKDAFASLKQRSSSWSFIIAKTEHTRQRLIKGGHKNGSPWNEYHPKGQKRPNNWPLISSPLLTSPQKETRMKSPRLIHDSLFIGWAHIHDWLSTPRKRDCFFLIAKTCNVLSVFHFI